jgi:hypothetical protein
MNANKPNIKIKSVTSKPTECTPGRTWVSSRRTSGTSYTRSNLASKTESPLSPKLSNQGPMLWLNKWVLQCSSSNLIQIFKLMPRQAPKQEDHHLQETPRMVCPVQSIWTHTARWFCTFALWQYWCAAAWDDALSFQSRKQVDMKLTLGNTLVSLTRMLSFRKKSSTELTKIKWNYPRCNLSKSNNGNSEICNNLWTNNHKITVNLKKELLLQP